MRAQSASFNNWTCLYCGTDIPGGYAHKCAEFDRAVTFSQGHPLAPMPEPQAVKETADRVTARCGPKQALVTHGYVQRGYYNGYLAGWHAGFAAAASGMEARRAETGTGSVHDSPTGEAGDAQP